ncbi:hypothetical protein RYX36_024455 [Vicia faba]
MPVVMEIASRTPTERFSEGGAAEEGSDPTVKSEGVSPVDDANGGCKLLRLQVECRFGYVGGRGWLSQRGFLWRLCAVNDLLHDGGGGVSG